MRAIPLPSLIDIVGHDVVSFRRNAHVSCMLVDRARDILCNVNGYIQGAERERDWTSFEKFTNAIDPVEPEDALLQLIAFTEDEKGRYLASGNSVEDCVASTEHRATNRVQIWSTLDVLATRTELTMPGNNFFEEVTGDINDTLTRFQRLHTKLDHLFTKMATGSISPLTLSLSLRLHKSDTLNGIVNLSLISTSIGVATRNHLRSTPVWDAAKDTCNETLKALKEAVAAVTELKIVDTVDFEDHPAFKALVVAQRVFQRFRRTSRFCCAKYYFLSTSGAQLNGDWNEKEQLNKALATDKVTVTVMDRTTADLVGHVTCTPNANLTSRWYSRCTRFSPQPYEANVLWDLSPGNATGQASVSLNDRRVPRVKSSTSLQRWIQSDRLS
ncbi:hypothetical protein BJV78DRAFT_1157321 [Lactifluus subvellereus]|nr:hypothetical protein BJV78DRAFT_1157321 [Lactifluus subvellereus]